MSAPSSAPLPSTPPAPLLPADCSCPEPAQIAHEESRCVFLGDGVETSAKPRQQREGVGTRQRLADSVVPVNCQLIKYVKTGPSTTSKQWPAGPMARRLTTNQEIVGSSPTLVINFWLFRAAPSLFVAPGAGARVRRTSLPFERCGSRAAARERLKWPRSMRRARRIQLHRKQFLPMMQISPNCPRTHGTSRCPRTPSHPQPLSPSSEDGVDDARPDRRLQRPPSRKSSARLVLPRSVFFFSNLKTYACAEADSPRRRARHLAPEFAPEALLLGRLGRLDGDPLLAAVRGSGWRGLLLPRLELAVL